MVAVGFIIISILVIHPIWVIDEYAIIDLIFLWFIPIIPPVKAFKAAVIIIILGEQWDCIMNDRTDKGPSFCQVDRIRQFIQEIDDITEGNQKWHGAIPNFNRIAVMMI